MPGPTRPGRRAPGAARASRPPSRGAASGTFARPGTAGPGYTTGSAGTSSAGPGYAASGASRRSAAPRQPTRRTRPPRIPRPVSGRAAALGLLLLALTLAYAYPVRVYLAQQAQIHQLQASQAAQRNRIADLQTQIARWNDPNYIITQARVRLGLVRKGELLFVVQADQPPGADSPPATGQSWVSQLWSNIQGADHPDSDK
jgi:cell division protein FtsB